MGILFLSDDSFDRSGQFTELMYAFVKAGALQRLAFLQPFFARDGVASEAGEYWCDARRLAMRWESGREIVAFAGNFAQFLLHREPEPCW